MARFPTLAEREPGIVVFFGCERTHIVCHRGRPRHLRDLHATILHLLDVDHRRLTSFRAGLEEKLTGVIEARPIRKVMA